MNGNESSINGKCVCSIKHRMDTIFLSYTNLTDNSLLNDVDRRYLTMYIETSYKKEYDSIIDFLSL